MHTSNPSTTEETEAGQLPEVQGLPALRGEPLASQSSSGKFCVATPKGFAIENKFERMSNKPKELPLQGRMLANDKPKGQK